MDAVDNNTLLSNRIVTSSIQQNVEIHPRLGIIFYNLNLKKLPMKSANCNSVASNTRACY